MMRMVSTDNDRDRGLEAFFVHAEATKEKISKIHSVISVIMHGRQSHNRIDGVAFTVLSLGSRSCEGMPHDVNAFY